MQLVSRRLIFLALCGIFVPGEALSEEKKLPPINAHVLRFVEARFDKQVAYGDC
jgi:hypothetical protein